jgi:hypothetical protein
MRLWKLCFALGLVYLFTGMVQAQKVSGGEKPLFTFIVSSDPHISDNRSNEPTGKEKFKRLLLQAARRSPRPEFMLITGDIHVEPFSQVLAETKAENKGRELIPLHVVPGNHEQRKDRDALHALFPADFKGNDFYSFMHKGSLFIGLCDVGNGDHIGHFNSEAIKGPEQGQWLKNQLADKGKKADHIFIFGHIPPRPDGTIEGGMFLSVNDQKFLREMVLEYKPTALFFGHLHSKMEFKIGSTPVFVLRSTNWNFNQEPLGFLEVKVFKTGMTTEFVPLKY